MDRARVHGIKAPQHLPEELPVVGQVEAVIEDVEAGGARLGQQEEVRALATDPVTPGIPVGAVGLDRGDNAALLAIEIIALQDEKLMHKLEKYRKEMREKAISK